MQNKTYTGVMFVNIPNSKIQIIMIESEVCLDIADFYYKEAEEMDVYLFLEKKPYWIRSIYTNVENGIGSVQNIAVKKTSNLELFGEGSIYEEDYAIELICIMNRLTQRNWLHGYDSIPRIYQRILDNFNIETLPMENVPDVIQTQFKIQHIFLGARFMGYSLDIARGERIVDL